MANKFMIDSQGTHMLMKIIYKVQQVTSDKQYVCPYWLQIAASQFQSEDFQWDFTVGGVIWYKIIRNVLQTQFSYRWKTKFQDVKSFV